MSVKILMPALSPTMTDGVLQKWLVKVGDKVKAGDLIAEIETDKATMEVEAVDEGTITNILVQEGTEGVAINSPIAILDGDENDEKDKIENNSKDHKSPDADTKMKVSSKKNRISLKSEKGTKSSEQQPSTQEKYMKKDSNVLASPYAKKLAKEQNINLSLNPKMQNIPKSKNTKNPEIQTYKKSLNPKIQKIPKSKKTKNP